MPICTEHFFRKRDKDLRQSDLYFALLQVKVKCVLPYMGKKRVGLLVLGLKSLHGTVMVGKLLIQKRR